MDFNNVRSGDCCAVDVHHMKARRSGSLTGRLGGCATGCLRNREVPDRGKAGDPGGAKDLLFITVEVAKTR